MTEAFLAKVFPISKKLTKKDKINNFVVLPGESMSRFWDRFTTFIKSIPNHHINYESLKEYFYRGNDDKNKEALDTIIGGVLLDISLLSRLRRN